MPDPLVIAEPSGAIALYRKQDSDGRWGRTQIAGRGFWPAWQPGGKLIAISTVEAARGGNVESAIRLVDSEGQERNLAYRTPVGVPPVIAPRIPHYVLWSPGGSVVSFVAPHTSGLSLFLSDPGGAYSADAVTSGGPIFSSWTADGLCLAVHRGADMLLYFPEARRSETVRSDAMGFRTPAIVGPWLLFARPGEAGVQITRRAIAGGPVEDLPSFPGGVAILARPGSTQAAVAVAADPNTGLFSALWLVDVEARAKVRQLFAGPFVSSTWSPRGGVMALVVPTQSGDGRYVVQALTAEGRYAGQSDAFVPGEDYRTMLGFFDQYAQSHHSWSTDGSQFLVAGRLSGDGLAASFSDTATDHVMAWSVVKGGRMEVIAPGNIGFFPPAE